MTIIKRKVNRKITEDEFLRLKTVTPFSDYRQDAKAVNFGFLFGMSYRKFTSQSLETSWTLDKVEAFIEERGLQGDFDTMQERHPDEDLRMIKYFTVANYIRTNFFKAYKGLEMRIKRNVAFAKENGYIRSHHGAIRRLPLFMLAFDAEGKKRPDERGVELSNWTNITSNTSIQTDEVSTIMQCIHEWIIRASAENFDAEIVGMVHDSGDFYVAKDQIVPVLRAMKEVFEKDEPWQKGVKFLIDIMITDFEDPDQYYKCGVSEKEFLSKIQLSL